ncbi:DUF4252 domain-containing protein [Rufibacter sp. XAAS-G3-1]|uniref:DUF4252 domain-containing protein n=1 Tax=Rufibacter sp. XAAS-G3-1 TaxID=2729134 RepID=UPI0015E7442E|nr:DUF4252 domain-containing protein [Rufibacter sp. XAAS-G3-1]
MLTPVVNRSQKPAFRQLSPFLAAVLLCIMQACSSTNNLPAAQSTTEFYQKYKNEAGFKGTTVPVGLVSRYLAKETTDTTLRAALANITSVRVLTFTPTTNKAQRLLERSLTQELDQVLQKDNYAAIPLLDEAPGALQFRIRQSNEQVQEIVGYRKHGNSFLMLQVNGRFTRQQVEQMLEKIDPDVLLPLLG